MRWVDDFIGEKDQSSPAERGVFEGNRRKARGCCIRLGTALSETMDGFNSAAAAAEGPKLRIILPGERFVNAHRLPPSGVRNICVPARPRSIAIAAALVASRGPGVGFWSWLRRTCF